MTPRRVAAGVPQGGQFAPAIHPEPGERVGIVSPPMDTHSDEHGNPAPTDGLTQEALGAIAQHNARGRFFVPPRPVSALQVWHFWNDVIVPDEVLSALILAPPHTRAVVRRSYQFDDVAAKNSGKLLASQKPVRRAIEAANAEADTIQDIPDAREADRVARSYGAFRDANLLPDSEKARLLGYPYLDQWSGEWFTIQETVDYYQPWRHDAFFRDPMAAKRYLDSVGH